LVAAQIILLSQWFNKKSLVKKLGQKDQPKRPSPKSTFSKWHFGQVGHGGKKTIGRVFFY
jgi:hypothetical protein